MLDRRRLERFKKSKEYRSTYIASRVRLAIALQIKTLREQYSRTQAEFARLIGKPQPVVSRLENPDYGKMSVQTLIEIADSLDIALVVKFVSYDKFFGMLDDSHLTSNALLVENFSETVELHEHIRASDNVHAFAGGNKLDENEINKQSRSILQRMHGMDEAERLRTQKQTPNESFNPRKRGPLNEVDLLRTGPGYRSISA